MCSSGRPTGFLYCGYLLWGRLLMLLLLTFRTRDAVTLTVKVISAAELHLGQIDPFVELEIIGMRVDDTPVGKYRTDMACLQLR